MIPPRGEREDVGKNEHLKKVTGILLAEKFQIIFVIRPGLQRRSAAAPRASLPDLLPVSSSSSFCLHSLKMSQRLSCRCLTADKPVAKIARFTAVLAC